MSGLSRAAQVFYAVLMGVMIGCAAWVILPSIETNYFPVNSRGDIVRAERQTPYIIRIWGTATKYRECNFEGLRWYRGKRSDRAVIIPVKFLEANKIRDEGRFDFGPWDIVLNEQFSLDETYADALHQCTVLGIKLPWITRSRFYN